MPGSVESIAHNDGKKGLIVLCVTYKLTKRKRSSILLLPTMECNQPNEHRLISDILKAQYYNVSVEEAMTSRNEGSSFDSL